MKKFMKMLASFAALATIFAFSSCSNDDDSDYDDNLKLVILYQATNNGKEVSRWTNTTNLYRFKMTYNSDGSSYGFPDDTIVETKQTLVFMSNNVVKAIYEADLDGDGTTETFETTKNFVSQTSGTMKYSGDTTKDGEITFSFDAGLIGSSDQGQATISGNTLTFYGGYYPGFESMTKDDYEITFDCYANNGVFTKVTE